MGSDREIRGTPNFAAGNHLRGNHILGDERKLGTAACTGSSVLGWEDRKWRENDAHRPCAAGFRL